MASSSVDVATMIELQSGLVQACDTTATVGPGGAGVSIHLCRCLDSFDLLPRHSVIGHHPQGKDRLMRCVGGSRINRWLETGEVGSTDPSLLTVSQFELVVSTKSSII